MLPFGPELMLPRVVRLLSEACRPIVVVAAPDQQLPPLPAEVLIARDRAPGRGPLEGLLAGLLALPTDVEAAYATGCDVPLLSPAVVRRMFELLGDDSAAVPQVGGYLHPLAAVYRRSLVEVIEQLLASDQLRASRLFDIVATRRVDQGELTDIDPALETLKNLNYPADYLAALAIAGFTAPAAVLARLNSAAAAGEHGV